MKKTIKVPENIDQDISPRQWLEVKVARSVILAFFESHPHTAFNHLTLVHAIEENYSNTVIDAALWQLIQEGWLSCRRQDKDRVYRLSGCMEPRLRNPFAMQ